MRRIFVLLAALALFVALPASAAVAQSDRVVVTVDVSESQVGVTADGSLVARGTYAVSFDGVVVESGVERSVYQVTDTTARGTRVYRSSTGEVTVTQIKAVVVEADEENGIFVYATTETVLSSTEGFTGHGVGTAVVTVHPDGSFSLESSTTLSLEF